MAALDGKQHRDDRIRHFGPEERRAKSLVIVWRQGRAGRSNRRKGVKRFLGRRADPMRLIAVPDPAPGALIGGDPGMD